MNEKKAFAVNGFLALIVLLTYLVWSFLITIGGSPFPGVPMLILGIVLLSGLTIVQPNQARVLTFFGRYMGSVRASGLWLTLPLTIHKKVSLRVRNFNSKTLKVNDINGNPVEIAAVVVFKVVDSAKAVFDVDDYEQFVEIQSETALRHVATKYPYDTFDDDGYSLRGNADEVADELARELQSRLSVAGVEVLEARLTHLAYATEIASAMLQRQQATAILAARQKIVEGAVGMAQMAIEQLQKNSVVELDEERKMAMINNLMVAIVSDRAAQPVINTGSLY
ncbi:Regulator of protease activity HflC, stomatin/prohibitin superfamily [Desulfotomaculum arcticum]|uniref:Regulator of protease activity HflC, stomatin/prohibitin superfamily n=1 Tax=Desulfotruncus arcticus DSM 17038 TaxID=1121424 RepID=A0A1I2WQR8_9FIRM|nr:SPFH domain-containing protein [Desulfotruncus arcticus]SFH03718.1 Regulator of protease activity HflC, stomatin/prohibitin superfamily [Desulfotomaculum arcticum] [Desulfotruncus arcticus DSM 17038]